jgi:hypothetical protein
VVISGVEERNVEEEKKKKEKEVTYPHNISLSL